MLGWYNFHIIKSYYRASKNPFKNLIASNSCHSFLFCDETKESRFHWLIYQGVMKEHNGTDRLVEYGSEEYHYISTFYISVVMFQPCEARPFVIGTGVAVVGLITDVQ